MVRKAVAAPKTRAEDAIFDPSLFKDEASIIAMEVATRPIVTIPVVGVTGFLLKRAGFGIETAALTLATVIAQVAMACFNGTEEAKTDLEKRRSLEFLRTAIALPISFLLHCYFSSEEVAWEVAILTSLIAYTVARAAYAALAIYVFDAAQIA